MAEQKRLHDAVEDYLRYRTARYAAETVKGEGYVLRRFAAWYGEVQLRHMRADRVSDWFYGEDGLMAEHRTRDRVHRPPVSPVTHNYYRTRLASLFRFCTQRGWLKQDLLIDVRPLKTVRRERFQPSAEVLLALRDAVESPRDRAFIATVINSGFRSKELSNLRVGQVDLANGWLTVMIFKTQQEDRFPITADLDLDLREWLHRYAVDLGRPLHEDDYLFPARTGPRYRWVQQPDGTRVQTHTPPQWNPARPLTNTQRVVQEALHRLGLPTRFEGTHTIRRAVARAFFDSMAGDVGYDNALRTVSALLHHKSSATTELYLGLTSERARRDDRLRGQPFLTAIAGRTEVLDLERQRARRTSRD